MKKDDIFSVILYGNGKIPKYFELKKDAIRLIVVIFPAITLLAIFLLILSTMHFQRKINRPPPQLLSLQNDLHQANSTIKELQENIEHLNQQIKNMAMPISATLSLFTASASAKENQSSIIQELKVSKDKKLNVQFKITNHQEGGISGYLFVVLYQGNQMTIYPSFAPQEFIDFKKGLPFSAQIFRAVNIDFDLPSTPFYLKIFVFKRSGDLLAYTTYKEE